MLTDRKKELLTTIIREHIREAQPVGSSVIVDKYNVKVSPATIRNEMMDLDKQGYLYQPHTSAGRLPTEKAWKFYLDSGMKEAALAKSMEKQLADALKRGTEINQSIKEMAKEMAIMSKQTVIFSFNPNDNFYTGIANLFRQPEFAQQEIIYELSDVIDHLDEVVEELFEKIDNQVEVFIGKENPFGVQCGFIATKSKRGLMGILGPIRQDYQHHHALLIYSKQLVTKL
ncbi:hypothetical protein ACFL04_00945 [Patescibacteria group bacterium]